MPEILAMIEGYNKRTYHLYHLNRALRYQIAFMLGKNSPPEIYDWEPLEGDPTKEERELAKVRHQVETDNEYRRMKQYYEAQGIDVM